MFTTHKFDIFEIFPEGILWRATVQSHEEGLQKMEKLPANGNEYRMMNLVINEIVATKRGS